MGKSVLRSTAPNFDQSDDLKFLIADFVDFPSFSLFFLSAACAPSLDPNPERAFQEIPPDLKFVMQSTIKMSTPL